MSWPLYVSVECFCIKIVSIKGYSALAVAEVKYVWNYLTYNRRIRFIRGKRYSRFYFL